MKPVTQKKQPIAINEKVVKKMILAGVALFVLNFLIGIVTT